MKLIVENIRSQLVTDDLTLLGLLYKKYSCYQPGYQYSPQYKRRVWDGKVRFFDATGRFTTGLLKRIQSDLERIGATYETEDRRNYSDVLRSDPNFDSFSLRDFQSVLFDRAMSEYRGIIEAPTGAGKTYIMGAIVSALRDNFGLVIFNKKQLLMQTYDKFHEFGLDVGAFHGEFKELKPITLVSKQSLPTVYDTFKDHTKFILFDEIHEIASGKKSKKLFHGFPHALYRFGFTATVPKEPMANMTLISSFGEVINEVTTKELVDKGTLARPTVYMITINHDHEADNYSYMQEYSERIVTNEDRNLKIKELAEALAGRTLIVVDKYEHQDILKKLIPDGYILNGQDDLETRKKTISKFIKKDKAIIIGTNIMQTGISIDEINSVINARGLKSEIPTLQLLGRGLRQSEGKTTVRFYDFYDNECRYLSKHAKNRKSAYEAEGHEVIVLQ